MPSTRQSAIDSCLLILKDWSNGLLLTDEEIDKERGVIHEEWRLRRSAQQRMLENQLETLYPGSKYGKRMPIGLMSVVDNFKYNELRDYYHKWYRPDNQALVIVGDVDVDHIEAQIKELFKGLPAPDPNAAQVVDEPVPDNDQPIIVVVKAESMSTPAIIAATLSQRRSRVGAKCACSKRCHSASTSGSGMSVMARLAVAKCSCISSSSMAANCSSV